MTPSGGDVSVAATPITNLVLWEDLADIDIFRVNNTFYYSASTMHYSQPRGGTVRQGVSCSWPLSSCSSSTQARQAGGGACHRRPVLSGVLGEHLSGGVRRCRWGASDHRRAHLDHWPALLTAAPVVPAKHSAVSRRGQTWSYARPDRAASSVANASRARGIGPEDVVAVVTEREPLRSCGLRGVVRAGGVDPPGERTRNAPVPVSDTDAPRTPTEQRMATAWARILQRPPDTMRRQDHFFESGGTSLLALRLIVALGGLISLEDLVRNPVLSDVAAIADDASRPDEGC